jgi:hypothetical protein
MNKNRMMRPTVWGELAKDSEAPQLDEPLLNAEGHPRLA